MFVAIAFAGEFRGEILGQIFITTFIIKALVIILGTPFFYLARLLMRVSPPPDLANQADHSK